MRALSALAALRWNWHGMKAAYAHNELTVENSLADDGQPLIFMKFL